MIEEDLKNVLERVEAAFEEVPMPPGDRIVYDNSSYNLEAAEIRAKFQGRNWRQLAIQDLEGESAALSFFTPEAYRFFLPAFLRVFLLDPDRADVIPDGILSSLARPDLSGYWEERREDLLRTLRERGIPERPLLDLVQQVGSASDTLGRARIKLLSESQKQAICYFVGFLRKYRAENFSFGELDLVEQALRT